MASVVIAEDDVTMARLLSSLLKLDGYEVTTVEDDVDVAQAVEDLAPDALILDMLFGTQDGLQVVDQIRRTDPGRRLYIVMISGLSARQECLQHGADDFLLKPFMPDELTDLLKTNLALTP